MNRSVRNLGLLTGLVCQLLIGCADKQQTPPAQSAAVTGVTLQTITMAPLPETLEVVGSVRARTSAMVAARIPGAVSVLHVREGDRVRKGQLLAQLESTENMAHASSAVAQLDEARQGVSEAQARKRLADATFDRFKQLFAEQALTRQEFEQKQTEQELARQGLARAESRLRQAQENARAAGTVADYTRITAPITGIITTKQVDLGSTVFPGQPLMTIEDEASYQLELAIPESLASKARPGTAVQVTLDALQLELNARVSEVVPATDPASRTFIAKVPLTQRGLKSGMFGRGRLTVGTTTTAILVPKTALFERGALTAVWTVGTDQTARMRLIKPGKTVADQIVVLSGLSEGDRIITGTSSVISDGTRIAP